MLEVEYIYRPEIFKYEKQALRIFQRKTIFVLHSPPRTVKGTLWFAIDKYIREIPRPQREYKLLELGVSALSLFIQHEWTGPKLTGNRLYEIQVLQYDHEPNYFLQYIHDQPDEVLPIQFPVLLVFAMRIFKRCHAIFPSSLAAQRWYLRSLFIKQCILDEKCSILYCKINRLIMAHEEWFKEPSDDAIAFYLEAFRIQLYYDFVDRAKMYLTKASSMANVSFNFTGMMGRRTCHQQFDLAQLVMAVNVTTPLSPSDNDGDESSVDTTSSSTDNDRSSSTQSTVKDTFLSNSDYDMIWNSASAKNLSQPDFKQPWETQVPDTEGLALADIGTLGVSKSLRAYKKDKKSRRRRDSVSIKSSSSSDVNKPPQQPPERWAFVENERPFTSSPGEPASTSLPDEPLITMSTGDPASITTLCEPPSTSLPSEPPSTTTPGEPPSTTTPGEPTFTSLPDEPPITMTTADPESRTTPCEPPSTSLPGEPPSTPFPGDPASTTTPCEPQSTSLPGEPPFTMTPCEPPFTMTPGDQPSASSQGEPPSTMTPGEPPFTMTPGEPPFTMTPGDQPSASSQGEPPSSMTPGEPPSTMTPGEPPSTTTPGEPPSPQESVLDETSGYSTHQTKGVEGDDETSADEYYPKNVPLEDDVRLDQIKLADPSEAEDTDLTVLAYGVLFGHVLLRKKSNPDDELYVEELVAMVRRLLQHNAPWPMQRSILFLRSHLERKSKRTIERAMMQVQSLADEYNNENPPPEERLEEFFISHLPTRREIEATLADFQLALGAVKSALDICLRWNLWELAIYCYTLLKHRHKAVALIEVQLEKGETPKLLCLLGDATDNCAHYERAWKISEEKSARAQRQWGNHLYFRKKFGESIDHYQKSLNLNCLQSEIWFRLGYAALHEERYVLAASAYRQFLVLEPDCFEAWNNLARCYCETKDLNRAFSALKEAVKVETQHWKVWENYVRVALGLRQYSEVIRGYNELLNCNKTCYVIPEVVRTLCDAYYRGERNEGPKVPRDPLLSLLDRLTTEFSDRTSGIWLRMFHIMGVDDREDERELRKECLLKAHTAAVTHVNMVRTIGASRMVIKIVNLMLPYAEENADYRRQFFLIAKPSIVNISKLFPDEPDLVEDIMAKIEALQKL